MNPSPAPPFPVLRVAACLASALCLAAASGCAISPQKLAGRPSRDHTFIAYWPPPAGNNQLKLAVKDNIDMQGVVTTAGSEHFAKNRPPAARDADCLALARKRGVYIVGKANLSEFAVAPSGINDYYGTPRSPFSGWRKLIPGGSSCGSAYAVATGKADIAFGTDTAGSIRIPAACCGVYGLKTTFGLVSINGVHPIEPTHLDTVGPLANDLPGVVQGMDLLVDGFAARHAAAVAARPSAGAIRIGRLRLRGTDRRIDKAVDKALEKAGFQIIVLDDAFRARWEKASSDGTAVAAAGTWISDRKYAASFGVSARTKSIIATGGVAYATQYRSALARKDDWQSALREVFTKVDFIALPTLQTTPPRFPPTLKVDLLKAQAEISDLQNTDLLGLALNPVEAITFVPATGLRLLGIDLLEASVLKAQNTVAVNYAGNPALAIPVPLRFGSVAAASLQLIGPPNSEADLLAAARFIDPKD